jgi:hypothetical protein
VKALPGPEEVTAQDVDAICRSGVAFNCAGTPWEQWVRFVGEANVVVQPLAQKLIYGANTLVAYSYEDPVDGKTVSTVPALPWKLQMCPRVALLSALLRAMGMQCPPDMRFASLAFANLVGTQLSYGAHPVDLSGSCMAGSVLTGGGFQRARLRGTHLYEASMQKCDLWGSDLTNARTSFADRRGARLGNATLKNCILDEGAWDPAPALPPQHTRSPKPLGIVRMVARSVMASGADDESESDGEDDDDESEVKDESNDAGEEVDSGKDGWEVTDTQEALLDEFLKAAKVKGIATGEALLHQMEDKTKRKDLLAKLKTNIAGLASHKQRIDKLAKKIASIQVAAQVAPMLDIKTLRGQFKTLKKAAAKNERTEEELTVLLRLQKETATAADRIEAQLKKSAKQPRAFARWAGTASVAHKAWLRSATGPLAHTRIAALLTASLESSSAYNFGFFTDFTAMMSTDARQLAGDKKELEILATELDELLVPISVLNWEDVLNCWMTLIELCGKFHGIRSQAILRQLFDDEKLLAAIGMANQCREIKTGENGADMPEIFLKLFKDGTAATLRHDKFTYQMAISREQANIDRVTKRQAQFVAFLGSIVLAFFMFVSNLASIWVAARYGFEDVSYDNGSL